MFNNVNTKDKMIWGRVAMTTWLTTPRPSVTSSRYELLG
jgi:hypothetical protein